MRSAAATAGAAARAAAGVAQFAVDAAPQEAPRAEIAAATQHEATQPMLDDEAPLLHLLRGFGPVVDVNTHGVVPKRAAWRVGKLGYSLIDRLMAAAAARETDEVLEEHVLRLIVLCAAILRRGTGEHRENEHPIRPAERRRDPWSEPTQWKTIRARLQLAEAGRWGALFRGLQDDCAATKAAKESDEAHEWCPPDGRRR